MNTVGIFYELPCGRIAKTYGYDGAKQRIHYYFDDEAGGHTVSMDEFKSWKPRTELNDFPQARDPHLPNEFNLFWDIKYMSELKRAIARHHVDLDAIQAAMERHNIVA